MLFWVFGGLWGFFLVFVCFVKNSRYFSLCVRQFSGRQFSCLKIGCFGGHSGGGRSFSQTFG